MFMFGNLKVIVGSRSKDPGTVLDQAEWVDRKSLVRLA